MFSQNHKEIERSPEQIYSTNSCASYQCDVSNALYLDIFGERFQLNVCTLISFRKKLFDVNLESLLLDSNSAPLEILNLHCVDKLFVLSIDEIIELRNLMEGTFAMLQLNSIIHQSIHRSTLV
ncbi:hypothetical protein [Reichenbachiella sp. MALMAid0571]|uniref:hypothetical protein n=1 Tax=Reichenbachiella sp. MALMAid0571 TaxID=3143939 RepID=UPI0032DED8DD